MEIKSGGCYKIYDEHSNKSIIYFASKSCNGMGQFDLCPTSDNDHNPGDGNPDGSSKTIEYIGQVTTIDDKNGYRYFYAPKDPNRFMQLGRDIMDGKIKPMVGSKNKDTQGLNICTMDEFVRDILKLDKSDDK